MPALIQKKPYKMPELPDVERFRKEAEKALGHHVAEVEIKDKHFVDASPHEFDKFVTDNKLDNTLRRGKHLFLLVKDNKAIALHFGMTGSLRYIPAREDPPKYTKCIFHLKNGHQLCYISKRKLGSVEITEDMDKYINEQDLGPDALEIEEEEFLDEFADSTAMVKSFLTDQSILAGIGNIYADEILFQAGVHPKKKCNNLSRNQAKDIYKKMKKVLEKSVEKDGDISELPGSYLLPHREKGNKCPRCDGKIKKIKISGRSGYYCPSCQPK